MILCFYSFGEFNCWWGFCVVYRVLEEVSSSCHCHGKGGEAGEPHRVLLIGYSQLQHGANSGPVCLLQQYSCAASCRRWGYCHSQSSARNCASLEFSLASVIHLTPKGCCDKFLHVQGQHEAGWVSANAGAERCLCCVYTVAERFQNEQSAAKLF